MAATSTPAASQKNADTVHSKTKTKIKSDAPLDFSFLNIISPKDILHEEPRGCKERQPDERYDAKCVKLNNNHIQEVTGLMEVLDDVILHPSSITWIDMSFNCLQKIDPVFCEFPSLQILYLHGNSIEDIKEVDKLAKVTSLRKLSLHGNAVETTKHYRLYVISQCAQLANFDMSTVSKAERETATALAKTITTAMQCNVHRKPKITNAEHRLAA